MDLADVDLRLFRTAGLPAGAALHRVASDPHPLSALNPSDASDTRFASLPDLPHAYVARSRTVALLETTFHEVSADPAARTIYTATDLARRRLGAVRPTRALRLLDIRDPQLARLNIHRSALVATSAAHYSCTRVVASRLVKLRPGGVRVHGLLWHSRVAEIARYPSPLLHDLLDGATAEVAIVYGDVHDPPLEAGGYQVPLLDNNGVWPTLVDAIAEALQATIE